VNCDAHARCQKLELGSVHTRPRLRAEHQAKAENGGGFIGSGRQGLYDGSVQAFEVYY